jgi:hypothetical protein
VIVHAGVWWVAGGVATIAFALSAGAVGHAPTTPAPPAAGVSAPPRATPLRTVAPLPEHPVARETPPAAAPPAPPRPRTVVPAPAAAAQPAPGFDSSG